MQEILILPCLYTDVKCSLVLNFCLALHLTPPFGEFAGVWEEVLNLSVYIYKTSGLSVVSPALLTVGEKDWCRRLGFISHLYSQSGWVASQVCLSPSLQTEFDGIVLQARVGPVRAPEEGA